MTVKEILTEARQLISNPENWLQGYLAQTISGKSVDVSDEEAVRFCALGALCRIGESLNNFPRAHDLLTQVCGTMIPCFNNTHSHEEVMETFDRAIALAEGGVA